MTIEIMNPFSVAIDLESGILKNPARTLTRKASDMLGHYSDGTALEKLIRDQQDPLHYTVQETPVPESYGQLMYCVSILEPGLVGDEFYMTKGHYHQIPETRGDLFMLARRRLYDDEDRRR